MSTDHVSWDAPGVGQWAVDRSHVPPGATRLSQEIFTPAERTLIGAGKGEHVQATRMAFQEAVRDSFVEIVEETTGRPVRTLISQVDLETGVAMELFLFESPASDSPPLPGSGGDDGT